MEELISKIVSEVELEEETARKAVGIVLHLVKTEGSPTESVEQIFEAMPGSSELAEAEEEGGGLMGALGGGAMAAFNKLTQAGLNMSQMQGVGAQVLSYAKEKTSDDLVDEVVNSIPGLGNFV